VPSSHPASGGGGMFALVLVFGGCLSGASRGIGYGCTEYYRGPSFWPISCFVYICLKHSCCTASSRLRRVSGVLRLIGAVVAVAPRAALGTPICCLRRCARTHWWRLRPSVLDRALDLFSPSRRGQGLGLAMCFVGHSEFGWPGLSCDSQNSEANPSGSFGS
jgi:hypothetical protein